VKPPTPLSPGRPAPPRSDTPASVLNAHKLVDCATCVVMLKHQRHTPRPTVSFGGKSVSVVAMLVGGRLELPLPLYCVDDVSKALTRWFLIRDTHDSERGRVLNRGLDAQIGIPRVLTHPIQTMEFLVKVHRAQDRALLHAANMTEVQLAVEGAEHDVVDVLLEDLTSFPSTFYDRVENVTARAPEY
jgi:hypothetical protein